MRSRMLIGMQWIGAVLIGVAGCQTGDHSLRHALREEYILPPNDDPRFSQPPQFPKEVLDADLLRKQPGKPNDANGGPPKFGGGSGGPGMGGY